ncbi:uncharacterized protein BP5553_10518 [Venustampulla echinocandica]|uniref:Uncharacterized protein n=1 Tax=Venustampulla echinocandica TaxID=2656787 RepID=A0A370T8T7_9HELO|nr:uncharacterized protein BP5553_10518 [Venustampulla echinocandica]RDL29891.1 hypothetical protein BP5553_10518 [Venustampulla echinocandica]
MAYRLLVLAPLLATLVASVSEVVPGPGLPTLAELGVTSPDLYNEIPAALSSHSKREDKHDGAICTSFGGTGYTPVEHVIACFNYLVKIGNRKCSTAPHTVCTIEETVIKANAYGSPASPDYIDCWDVALGVQKVFTECNIDGKVSGQYFLPNVANAVKGVFYEVET